MALARSHDEDVHVNWVDANMFKSLCRGIIDAFGPYHSLPNYNGDEGLRFVLSWVKGKTLTQAWVDHLAAVEYALRDYNVHPSQPLLHPSGKPKRKNVKKTVVATSAALILSGTVTCPF